MRHLYSGGICLFFVPSVHIFGEGSCYISSQGNVIGGVGISLLGVGKVNGRVGGWEWPCQCWDSRISHALGMSLPVLGWSLWQLGLTKYPQHVGNPVAPVGNDLVVVGTEDLAPSWEGHWWSWDISLSGVRKVNSHVGGWEWRRKSWESHWRC